MPHKRNPAACAVALAAATHVPGLVAAFLAGMPQEHERGVGGWQAEGATVAATVQATGAALSSVADAVSGLVRRSRTDAREHCGHTWRRLRRARHDAARAHAWGANRRAASSRVPSMLRAPARARSRKRWRPTPTPRASWPPPNCATLDSPEAYLGAAEEFRKTLLADDDGIGCRACRY